MYRIEHIQILYLLALIPLLILLFLVYLKWKAGKFKLMGDSHLLSSIIKDYSPGKQKLKFWTAILIVILLIAGASNLQMGGKADQKAKRETIDLIMAVDISHSMLAEDVKPSRMERARLFCMKLAEELHFAKIGIVLFAGDAYIHMPLTTDMGAVKMFIQSISPDLISLQGTAIGTAIMVASDAFDRTEAKNKAVILVSDGENFEGDAIEATQIAQNQNIIIHTAVFGTSEGGPIPIRENGKITGFKRDAQNTTVITRPDLQLLAQIAAQTGGISVDGSNIKNAVPQLIAELDKLEKEEGEAIQFSEYDTLFAVFALPALILLIIDFFVAERKMKWQNIIDNLLNFSLKSNGK